jgi:cell wall assembly regulator SMI1
VRRLWERLERWFDANLPGKSLSLRDGASEDAIAAAEARLGVRFPDDYRASLRVHDGQWDEPDVFWLPFAQRLGSLESLVGCWENDRPAYDDDPQRFEWLDPAGRARQVHFHPRQIPIAGSPDWDYDRLLLDFVPGPNGTPGQVIARCDIEIVCLCSSFSALLEQTVRGLEAGRIVCAPPAALLEGKLEMQCVSPRAKKPIGPFGYFH